jgi:hypothetical protein
MGQPSKVFASLNREKAETQTDRELAVSYLELQELRQQVRIAQCGRAILTSAGARLADRKESVPTRQKTPP